MVAGGVVARTGEEGATYEAASTDAKRGRARSSDRTVRIAGEAPAGGDMRRESGVERRESGVERRESGVERRESGVERRESGVEMHPILLSGAEKEPCPNLKSRKGCRYA
jgi:hypothetical protein